jgi:hypothetical protein
MLTRCVLQIYEPLKASKQLEILAFPCDQFMHQEKGALRAPQQRSCGCAGAHAASAGDTAEVCSFAARKGAKWPTFDKARACSCAERSPVPSQRSAHPLHSAHSAALRSRFVPLCRVSHAPRLVPGEASHSCACRSAVRRWT